MWAAPWAALLALFVEEPVKATLRRLPLAALLVLVLHEGVHAAVGLLAGLRVRRVTIGTGPLVGRIRVRNARLELRLIPVSGATVVVPRRDPRRVRSRAAFLVMVAAGPATDACLALGAVSVGGPLAIGVFSTLFTYVFAGAVGMVPTVRAGHSFGGPSDLRRLLSHGRKPVPVDFDDPRHWGFTREDVWAWVEEVHCAQARGQVEAAAAAARRLAELQPEVDEWSQLQAYALLREGRFEAARELALMARPWLKEEQRAGWDNMLAWTDAVLDAHPGEMAEALVRARATLPEDASLLDTAALVAARQGRLDEAEAYCSLIDESELTDDPSRAGVLITRSFLALQRGDEVRAMDLARTARQLDPESPVFVPLLGIERWQEAGLQIAR
jgi:predicted Zn-dependent protease